jgi:hypothetical protein
MPEIAHELLSDDDDDFVFEPNGWDLAMSIGLQVDPETDREVLDELADAMLVWAQEEADRLAGDAAAALWDDELARSIRDGLKRVRQAGPEWRTAAEGALDELDLLGCRSEIAREVAAHLALQLSHLDDPWTVCICCVDEGLAEAPPERRRELACQVAHLTRRNAGIPDEEVRAALIGARFQSPVRSLATDERRRAVRARLARIGRLARTSMPLLAAELEAIGAEELPERPEHDDAWAELCQVLVRKEVRPDWN